MRNFKIDCYYNAKNDKYIGLYWNQIHRNLFSEDIKILNFELAHATSN